MHGIYVRALVKLFHHGMESWSRGYSPDPRLIRVSEWIQRRDPRAQVEAQNITMEEAST